MPCGASFDDVARLLVNYGSRRAVLRALAAALGTGWTDTHLSTTATPNRRCRKLGKTCSRRKPCCKGTRCVRGRCACPRTKKPCRRACIARTACCPATEDRCRGKCVPKGSPCCTAQERTCGNQCIADSGCCTGDDCTGPCDTGTCGPDHQCILKDVDTPCGRDRVGVCTDTGACVPKSCQVDSDCPNPPHFCRAATCADNQCIADWDQHKYSDPLPQEQQVAGDCLTRICDPSIHDGVGLVFNAADVPPNDNPCIELQCVPPGLLDTKVHVGQSCLQGTDWICDANGDCGPP